MTDPTRHEVPLESGKLPGRRGKGAESVLPHVQQQVQATTSGVLMPQAPTGGQPDSPVKPD